MYERICVRMCAIACVGVHVCECMFAWLRQWPLLPLLMRMLQAPVGLAAASAASVAAAAVALTGCCC